jgi:hypothetical protein
MIVSADNKARRYCTVRYYVRSVRYYSKYGQQVCVIAIFLFSFCV